MRNYFKMIVAVMLLGFSMCAQAQDHNATPRDKSPVENPDGYKNAAGHNVMGDKKHWDKEERKTGGLEGKVRERIGVVERKEAKEKLRENNNSSTTSSSSNNSGSK